MNGAAAGAPCIGLGHKALWAPWGLAGLGCNYWGVPWGQTQASVGGRWLSWPGMQGAWGVLVNRLARAAAEVGQGGLGDSRRALGGQLAGAAANAAL